MKIAYTINGIYNSGGKERILTAKANYLADVMGYDVTIITTYQGGRVPFFKLSGKVKLIDLGIRYDIYENKKVRLLKNIWLKRLHRKKLQEILKHERFDIVDSFMDFDFGFLFKIKDGSKKILEFHFSKYSKVKEAKKWLVKALQYLRIVTWRGTVCKYDRFIVLTHEDAESWGRLPNIEVIPNFITPPTFVNYGKRKRIVLSIGRFTYQKGFDLLIDVWNQVQRYADGWKLKIVGGGDKTLVQNRIDLYGLNDSVIVEDAKSGVDSEYDSCSLFVMTSRYEGLPMVLLEAISHGVPVISFDFPCGPKDIIKSDFGSLISDYDIEKMAKEILSWIYDEDRRSKVLINAVEESKKYSETVIIERWDRLYQSVIS